MSKRRLSLRRETMTELLPDELGSVVGAISGKHVVCAITSLQHSMCHTCGIACTYDCQTS